VCGTCKHKAQERRLFLHSVQMESSLRDYLL